MQLRYIESFLTLYEELNFTKASLRLFISQQGLSRQILSLENELGAPLFQRTKNGVVPTPLCQTLHPQFKEIHEHYSQIKVMVQANRADKDAPVTIAFANGISHGLNTDVILKFQQSNPHVRFEIKEWSQKVCIEKLLNGQAHIGLLVNPPEPERFESHFLTEGYMYAALHKDHPLANLGEVIDFRLLDGQTIITGSEDNVLRQLFDHYCKMTEIRPNIMFSSSYSVDIINSTEFDMPIATVTPIMAGRITNPNIKILRLLTPEPGCLYCCTAKEKVKSPALKTMISYIQDYFRQMPLIKLDD